MLKLASILAITLLATCCSTVALNTSNQSNLGNVDFTSQFKVGEACESSFLIFGPFGSSSIVSAAKSSKIKTVEVVEQKSTNALIYKSKCTIVYGK